LNELPAYTITNNMYAGAHCETLTCMRTYTSPHMRIELLLYCIVFMYLFSAPLQPWANIFAFGSISSKKRDKF